MMKTYTKPTESDSPLVVTSTKVSHAACLYCGKTFENVSPQSVLRHMAVEREEPLETGFVYKSTGYNIITPRGGLLTGDEFGKHRTHKYLHHVASCRLSPDGKLEFEPYTKARNVGDLHLDLIEQRIRLPTKKEIELLREGFFDYLNNTSTDRTTPVWNALEGLTPEELKRTDPSLRRIENLVLSA